jgi:deoxyribodipyrimidine photolyase
MISFLKLTSTSKYQMSIFLFLSTLLLAVDVSHQLSTPTPTAATKPSTNKVVWFRNHVLRIQDNQALDEAISECQRSSSSSSSTSLTDSASAIIPIYLWDEQCNDDINTSGGTASDLFIAHTLKSLNDSMDGMLGQGFIEKSVTADADETTTQNQQNYHSNIDINEIIDTNASTMVKELVSICEKSSSSDIYYIRSNNVPLEEKIIHYLHENGITPHPSHGCSLLDYSTLDVPWTDIILAHPWRSPLIPFVDYVLEKLEENPPSKPIDVPMETLLPFISHAESKIFNNPIEIEALLQTMGRSSGGTEWGTTIIESFSQNNDGAMKELDSFIQSMTLKGAEKRTHFTSRLSPYLARGLLSPKQVYHAILSKGDEYDSASIVRRICWRDYTHAVVSLFPDVLYGRPIRLGYGDYVDDDLDDEKLHLLKMWKKGLTGMCMFKEYIVFLLAFSFANF